MEQVKNNKKIRLSTTLFYICYTGIILQNMLNNVIALGDFSKIMSSITLVMLMVICIFNAFELRRKSIILLIVSAAIIVTTSFITNDSILLLVLLTVVACKSINIEKLMKYDIVLKLTLLLIVTGLYFAGMTAIHIHYRDGSIRHSMGFSNPNTFSTYVMSIVLEYLFIHRKKIRIKEVIITLVSVLIIDYFADSRTQIICILLALALLLIRRRYEGLLNNKAIRLIITNIFLFMLAISSLIVQIYIVSPTTAERIDSITSGRIHNSAIVAKEYDLTILGNSEIVEHTVEKKGFAFDNSYIYIPYVYGIIPTLFLIVIMRNYMKHMLANKEYDAALIMFVLIVGGIMEKTFLRIHFDIFLLYFAYMLYGNPETNPKKLKSKNTEE